MVLVNHKKFLGYTKDEDGELIIVPEQAKVVRRIYRLYLEGLEIHFKSGIIVEQEVVSYED